MQGACVAGALRRPCCFDRAAALGRSAFGVAVGCLASWLAFGVVRRVAASRLTVVVAWRFFPGFGGGEPCRADVACWGGWGSHTPCARQIGPHPPQPTPPSRHGSLRYVWGRRQKYRASLASWLHRFPAFCPVLPFPACPRIPVQAHTGSRGQGVSRSDNLCSQCAEDGSPLVRAQSEVTPLNPADQAQQRHLEPRGPSEAASPQSDRSQRWSQTGFPDSMAACAGPMNESARKA